MSNPDEQPGENVSVYEAYLARMRERLSTLVPVTAGLGLRRTWAATIDSTPDHLPIIGPALGPEGPLAGVTVASAGGHGRLSARRSPGSPPTWRSPAPPRWWTRPRSGWTGSTRPAAAGWRTAPIALPFPEMAPAQALDKS